MWFFFTQYGVGETGMRISALVYTISTFLSSISSPPQALGCFLASDVMEILWREVWNIWRPCSLSHVRCRQRSKQQIQPLWPVLDFSWIVIHFKMYYRIYQVWEKYGEKFIKYPCIYHPNDKILSYLFQISQSIHLIDIIIYYIYMYSIYQRRQRHPTPVLLPGKSHGRRSLVGCSPWGRWGSDTTERLHFHFTFMHWRRKWQPTPVFLPGESQGRGSLVGYRLWGHTQSDTTEAT